MEDEDLWEPHVDINALFAHYNALYFENSLGAAYVEWSSKRMTSCGGVCEYRPGGGCCIKLSEPLLKFRPSRDIKNVLLHEMIHAHMMLSGTRDDDRSGHGTIFKHHMQRINGSQAADWCRPAGGYALTIYHSMTDEVRHYQQHHWSCERCRHLVRRATNRPPQEADCWRRRGSACADPRCSWHMHLRHCGGAFVKVQQPADYGKKKARPGRGIKGGGPAPAMGEGPGAASSSPGSRPEANAQASILHFFKANGLAPPAEEQEGAAGMGRASASAQRTPLPAPAQDTREEMRRKAAEAALARMSKDESTLPPLTASAAGDGRGESAAGPALARDAESAVIDLT